jgi:hypothetical protein
MSFLSWLGDHISPNRESSLSSGEVSESRDLAEAQRDLVRFTRALQKGEIEEGEKILKLKRNVYEQAILADRLRGELP